MFPKFHLISKIDNLSFSNIVGNQIFIMSKEKKDKEWKELEHEEMKEEAHQLELKEGYEQDEAYEESED